MSRFDIIARVSVTAADGTKLVDIPVRREDVTTTNGAYRCVRDEAIDEVTATLRAMLAIHRAGGELTADNIECAAAALALGEPITDWFPETTGELADA